MIVFSAICPHPPILIPTIGKDNLDKIKQTEKAMKNLEQELYASKPDVVLVISPHGELIPDAFSLNLNSVYSADFENFGDFKTKMEFKSSPKLSLRIKERVEDQLPIVLVSEPKLDHGIGVPLYYLSQHLKGIKIIPVYYSLLDYKLHYLFGQLIKKELVKSDQRVAVIASGDLSHCLIKGAPAPYSAQGEKFDTKLVELISKKQYEKIMKMDKKLIEKAAECGLRSFLILFGIIEQIEHNPEVLSYEGPFGVGYLTVNFKFK